MSVSHIGLKAAVGLWLIIGLCGSAPADPVKVKTVVDNAGIKATPEIGAKSLIKLPLATVVTVLDKQGEWFKVSCDKDGKTYTGFIHEMLVEETAEPAEAESKPEAAAAASSDPAGEIEAQVEAAKALIRQEKSLVEAEDALGGLLAKSIGLADPKKQKALVIEIYLWLGISRVTRGDEAAGLKEFRRMFDVDTAAAREATRNIATPKIDALLKLAEQESLGLISDYGLEVISDPPDARVFFDGQDMGSTPGTFRWASPKFVLELKKAGFVPVREDVLLLAVSSKKSFRLEFLQRDLSLSSVPPGAAVFVDGRDTGRITNCRVEGLAFGRHEIRLARNYYLDWTSSVEITDAEQPLLQADLVGKSYAPAGSWGERGSGLFDNPIALAADREGFLYVLDESSGRVVKLTAEGRAAADWKVTAPEWAELKSPTALAVDAQGILYLADGRRHVILKVGRDGRSASVWKGEGGGTSEFRLPAAMAFDSAGHVYVIESGTCRIKKYSGRGDFIRTWGTEGKGDGQFLQPRAVAVNGRDEIFVLDRSRVQKFSADGAFLASWGEAGRGEGQFQNPRGLAVDAAGAVYVADSDNHRVQKFEAGGRLVAVWGAKGRDQGRFSEPVSIWVGGQGIVHVLEKGNERIQRFVVGPPLPER